MLNGARLQAVLFLLFASMALGACSEPDDETIYDPFPARLETPSTSLVFHRVAIGDTATKNIEVTNEGLSAARIETVELREQHGGEFDGRREFRLADDGWSSEPVVLEPGESHAFVVQYTRLDAGADYATLTIDAPGTRGLDIEVILEAPVAEPEIATELSVNFQRVPPRTTDPDWRGEWKRTTVQNLGLAPLRVDDIYVAGSDNFRLSFPDPEADIVDTANDTGQWPQALAPNASFDIRVWFAPDDNLPESAQLVFETNDPDDSVHSIELSGNSGGPCLMVSPSDEIDFGEVLLGQEARKTVTLENCSRTQTLEIDRLEISDDPGNVFSIDGRAAPMHIEPGERTSFDVVFRASGEGSFRAELLVESNDPASPTIRVPVRGIAGDFHCPQARAKAWVQGANRQQTTIETSPLNTIVFDGSESSDPNGDIVRYEWALLSRPEGSTQHLLPSNNVVSPRLFLDAAGIYEVELRVFNDQGQASCGDPAIITINSMPEDDVYIQLIWDTPTDPDQKDTFGTDLDLHYLHPNGRWDAAPWDIFWRNPQADWGMQGSGSDDPSLDINDTDGLGPEHITHSGAESLTYRVGVYYSGDNGFGPSYATVRIYSRGQLAFERQIRHLAHPGIFWEVAKVTWPAGTVRAIDKTYDGFPERP